MRAIKDWIPVLLTIIAGASAIAAWSVRAQIDMDLAPTVQRVIVLETRREADSQRLERIEDKVDRLLERQPKR